MKKAVLTVSLFVVMFPLIPSCGKKAPPFLPAREPLSARVVALEGKWVGDDIQLRGGLAGPGENTKNSGITGIRVYYAEYPLISSPCEGCPLVFDAYEDFGDEVLTHRGFTCKVRGRRKDRVHYFRVHFLGDRGVMGPPSNVVKVVSEPKGK